MRRQHDDSLVESALRRILVRPRVPVGFSERVMAGIREEGRRESVKPGLAFPRLSMRMSLALTGCAGLAMLLFSVGRPAEQIDQRAEPAALNGAARELAEVLHLASNKWNQAQEAALSPGLDNNND